MDAAAFAWAQGLAKKAKKLAKVDVNLATFVLRLDRHVSLYHDKETNVTFRIVVVRKKNYSEMYISLVTNYDKILKNYPETVNLLLCTGDYLYTRLTGGKGDKVVKIAYIK